MSNSDTERDRRDASAINDDPAALPSQRAAATDRDGGAGPAEATGAKAEALIEHFPGLDPNPGLGSRAALPEGSLPGSFSDVQGDEHRKPPDNAPAPVNAQPTVETARQSARSGAKEAGRTD